MLLYVYDMWCVCINCIKNNELRSININNETIEDGPGNEYWELIFGNRPFCIVDVLL